MNKTCIVLAGPTAVGKTSIALELAAHFNTQIISADSRQCFKELDIGVAKPSQAELSAIHHYFINSHSIHEKLSAADFEKYALEAVGKIFKQNDIAVMVGGTGLYIKAFCEGLDEIPAIDEKIRNEIIVGYDLNGIGWLKQQIVERDPLYFTSGEMQNPQRMMRALEVKLSTGNSITSFQTKQKVKRNFDIIQVGLELPRDILYGQINSRVDAMMKKGLEEEVSNLLPYKHLNALQTVGYRELFNFYDKETSLPKAVELIKQNTRHYAKRQMTWFKKNHLITWLLPDINVVSEYLRKSLGDMEI